MSDVLSDAAIAFMTSGGDSSPFFAFVPYNTPHSPHFVDDEFLAPYLEKGLSLREARIYGQVSQMDASIGRVLGALDANGLSGNTLVLFLGDNGGISRHNRLGLRGGKASPFEGGIRTPFLARWPGRIPAGKRVDAMVSHLDIFPTLCELLKVQPPEQRPFDGTSIASLMLRGEGVSPHEYLVHSGDRHRPRLDIGWSVTTPWWKLTYEGLYDLSADPGEQTDLSAKQPEVVADLKGKFIAWMADVTAGRNFEPPPIGVGKGGDWVEIQMSWTRLDGTHTTWGSPGSTQTAGPDRLGDPQAGATVNYAFAGYNWDAIESWRRPGESVKWKLDVARDALYEMDAGYGCDPADEGGIVRFTAGGESLEATIQATPGRRIYRRIRLGTLRLEKGVTELTATVVRAPGKELMTLNRIWLRRIDRE